MSNNPTTTVASLVDVQLAFEQWRTQRTSRKPTPEHLRCLALSLLDEHVPSVICKALGINCAALKLWQKPVKTDKPAGFVALPPATDISLDQQDDAATLQITLPNGVRLSLACNEHSLALALKAACELRISA